MGILIPWVLTSFIYFFIFAEASCLFIDDLIKIQDTTKTPSFKWFLVFTVYTEKRCAPFHFIQEKQGACLST